MGREAETQVLAELAASAAAGAGRTALVSGEAGIGKTALLRSAAATAERLGMRVLYAAAQELEHQRPFTLMSACLGMDSDSADPARARAAEFLRDEARYGLPGATATAALPAVGAMLGLVEDMCAQGPLALVLDDLQWADPASVQALHRLMLSAQQLPLLIAAAWRPVPRAREVNLLSRTLAVGVITLLELESLTPSAVSALLADQCGGEPGPRLRRVAEGAAGNPLYLEELVAALHREEAIEVRAGTADVSVDCELPSLPGLITHRLAYLRDDVLHVLRVAAVLGSDCTVTRLAAVLEKPTHELLRIVAEVVAAGVLRDDGDRLVFRHDLIRRSLYDAVTGSAREMLHLRAAQALAHAATAPERVAEHLLQGAPEGGEFLTAWLVQSAARLTTRAPALALGLLRRALALGDPGDPRRELLHLHHAVAQLTRDVGEAEEGDRVALSSLRDPRLESTLRWITVQASFARGRPDRALDEARTACASPHVPTVDSVRFQAFGSICLLASGDLAQTGATAAAARRSAGELGDNPALAHALHVLAAKRFVEAPDDEALELARQASSLMPETMHPAQWLGGKLAMANCYADLDHCQDALRTLAAVRDAVEHTGGVFLPWYHLSCALLAFHAGDWDDALADVEAGLGSGKAFGMSRALHAVAALIAVHRDQTAVAEAHLTASDGASDSGTFAWFYEYLPLCASALIDEARNEPERAYRRLALAFDRGIGHLPGRLILGFLTPDLVRLALAGNDTANARRFADAARARSEISGAPHHVGDARRCQGLLLQDPDLLLDAARCYQEAPRPLNEARACTDAAELLARSGRLAEARAALDRALALHARLGADWDAARATTRLRAARTGRGGRTPPNAVRHGWNALTTTERLIADHVAKGQSNPKAAACMGISPRTVSTHVSNILRKLGMTSRVELAAEVIRRQNRDRPSGRSE
ncbi:AAA family ATPase [Streptomyces sp. NBC_01210]|uniref:ATP-binding protein n=1 Tax=Streptomyces sp. NBC_01210 TaxID=2903774 RepID=UPI002E0D3FB4|nr:AAA family ATPase [Streptomyces sp. NBC_01210]